MIWAGINNRVGPIGLCQTVVESQFAQRTITFSKGYYGLLVFFEYLGRFSDGLASVFLRFELYRNNKYTLMNVNFPQGLSCRTLSRMQRLFFLSHK